MAFLWLLPSCSFLGSGTGSTTVTSLCDASTYIFAGGKTSSNSLPGAGTSRLASQSGYIGMLDFSFSSFTSTRFLELAPSELHCNLFNDDNDYVYAVGQGSITVGVEPEPSLRTGLFKDVECQSHPISPFFHLRSLPCLQPTLL